MATHPIDILPFQEYHQPGVGALMKSIAGEFPETIFSPQSKPMKEVAFLPTQSYWVASVNDTVIGTVGLLSLADNQVELKRLFLAKERGQGVAISLLETAIKTAMEREAHRMFLGTMNQFKAAQLLSKEWFYRNSPGIST